MLKIEFRAMGCAMTASLDNGESQAARTLELVPRWFEEWEQALSRFRPDSDLTLLNASAGAPCTVGSILWEVIQAALETARWTGGLVVPTVLKSLERVGYDRSFAQVQTTRGGRPSAPSLSIEEGRTAVASWRDVSVDKLNHTVTLPPGTRLDLGGVAKGWAAWQAMQRLKVYGPALVDAGGDIAVSDVRVDESPWMVAIADPLQMQEKLDLLALGNCGVATSGIDYRRWIQNGSLQHHIIDPRSGEPAQTDLVSVTVIAPDVLQAEAAAKAVLILGSQVGFDWLEDRPQLCGLLALQDGRLLYSSGIQDYLWS
jgi:thiamine biosynthesis lipoprotein